MANTVSGMGQGEEARASEGLADLNKLSQVVVFTTGGTIEKTYDESDGSLENRGSVLQQQITPLLRLPYTQLVIQALLCKDSLFMTDDDRQIILDAVRGQHQAGSPIVILHGTDTMDLTALFCAQHLVQPEVAVVFTGAMKPIGFKDSDAVQNFTEALMAAKIVRPGYYISFHNRLFPVGRVRKNRRLNTFEAL